MGMRVRDVSAGAPSYLAHNVSIRTIVGVAPGGPADAAGLRVGDRIVYWETRPWHALRAGERVTLTVQRLVPQPPAGVAGFDRYRAEEVVQLVPRPPLTSEWPRLLATSVVALTAGAVGAAVGWMRPRRGAVLSGAASAVAFIALAGPLAETWHRAPGLGWALGAGATLAVLLPFVGAAFGADLPTDRCTDIGPTHARSPARSGTVVLRAAAFASLLS